jgi:hypothetical protein
MATYYVSNNGSDGAAGTSDRTPWQTVSKVNGFTFNANDTVLFRRGDRWLESLVPPRNTMTFGAYGNPPVYDGNGYCTNAPCLDGGAYITSWAAYAGGDEQRQVVDEMTDVAGTNLTAHTSDIGLTWAKCTGFADNIVISNANRARRNAVNTRPQYNATPLLAIQDYYVEGDVFVASTDTDFVEFIARGFAYTDKGWWVRLSGASGGLALGYRIAGTNTSPSGAIFATVAAALGSYSAGVAYRMRIEVQGSNIRGYIGPAGGGLTKFYDATDTNVPEGDRAMIRMGAAASVAADDTHGLHVDRIEQGSLGTFTPVDTYKATSSASYVVAFDRTLAAKGKVSDQLNYGEYYAAGGVIYIKRKGGVPDNTTVRKGVINFGCNAGTRTGLTFDGLGWEYFAAQGITSTTGLTDLVVKNCMMRYGGSIDAGFDGCIGGTGTPNITIQNCVLLDIGNDGIYFSFSGSGGRMIVTDTLIGPAIGANSDCIQLDAGGGVSVNSYIARCRFYVDSRSPKGNLILFGNDHTVEDNYMEGGKADTTNTGSYGLTCVGDNVVFRHNTVVGAGNQGVRSGTGATTNWTIEKNIFLDCGQAIDVQVAMTNVKVRNNVIVNVRRPPTFLAAPAYMIESDASTTGEFSNNLIWDSTIHPTSAAGQYHMTTIGAAGWQAKTNTVGPGSNVNVNWLGTTITSLPSPVMDHAALAVTTPNRLIRGMAGCHEAGVTLVLQALGII